MEIVSEVLKVLELEGRSILQCRDRLKSDKEQAQLILALECLQKALEQGGKIVVTGVGKSGKVAQKIAATLCSTGSLAVFLHPTDGIHGDLGVIQPKDAILILSYTGNTEEVLRLLPSLKARGVSIIGLGGRKDSRLAEQCTAWIDGAVESEACPHNLAPTSSTTLALALGDALAVTLMKIRKFDADSFALNHPGGSLGKRLNLKVSDLMHSGEAVGLVGPQASMDEVVICATQKKLGAVLVVHQTQLLGIITDGDLRRALQHREKFFQLKASEVMTQNPVTAAPEMMAQTALELMENRPSQINVLPVVRPTGEWVGLLRLHDLIQAF